MLTEHAINLDEIFVGRTEELKILWALWNKSIKDEEHFVYVMLNAPGTGKTRLLQYFGEMLEREKKGFFFRYNCTSHHSRTSSLNLDIVTRLRSQIATKKQYILEYITNSYADTVLEWKRDDLRRVITRLERVMSADHATLEDVVWIFRTLSDIIPMVFVADEIQELQKRELLVDDEALTPTNQQSMTETALRYFTEILRDWLSHRLLIVLSGTQYHILQQIGYKIGSPIAQKVQHLLIKNFSTSEVDEYVQQVNDRFLSKLIPPEKLKVQQALVTYYQRFLHAFSGGHPRTMVLMTQWFLADVNEFLETLPSYDEFTNTLFNQVEKDFKLRILTREKQDQIKQLQENEAFPLVKQWLINSATTGFNLGKAPVSIPSESLEAVEDLIYQLMTLGIIVKNGLDEYHLTSYFHLLAFLECFTGDHELFLRTILTNRLFKLSCGGHAGFGYTFEHVFLSALLLGGMQVVSSHEMVQVKETASNRDLPISINDISTVHEISGDANWKELHIKPNVLYHAPHARSIDFFILNNDQLTLIQVSTAKHGHKEKIKSLMNELQKARQCYHEYEVKGWYVSLFPISANIIETNQDSSLVISSGDELSSILGEKLLKRLLNIKSQLIRRD